MVNVEIVGDLYKYTNNLYGIECSFDRNIIPIGRHIGFVKCNNAGEMIYSDTYTNVYYRDNIESITERLMNLCNENEYWIILDSCVVSDVIIKKPIEISYIIDTDDKIKKVYIYNIGDTILGSCINEDSFVKFCEKRKRRFRTIEEAEVVLNQINKIKQKREDLINEVNHAYSEIIQNMLQDG